MIEKTATRVLDAGAAITRQSGRGRLVVVKGPDRGETIAVGESPLTVGSGGGSSVLLSDPTISRKHLGIDPGPTGLVLRDLGSTNGSFVQGSRFKELTLAFGAEVKLGQTVLKYLPDEEMVELAPSDKESFGSLVGRDPKMRQLFRVLDDVAATEATVLIEGETGTGKELIAEEIHRHSPRRDGPFVVFDCGAVPDELIESELFGHVRGAFTGAVTDRRGAFEEADGGTMFLDEIGELALDLQPALLRVLDKQAVRPVGGSTYTQRRRARRRGDQPRPARRGRRAAVPRGPVLPARGGAHGGAAAARAPRRHPAAGRSTSAPLLRRPHAGGFARGPGAAAPPRLAGQRARAAQRDRARVRARATASGSRSTRRWTTTPAPAPRGPSACRHVDVDLPFKEAKARVIETFEREYIRTLLKRHEGNLSAAARSAEIDRKHLRELLRKHGLRESSEE